VTAFPFGISADAARIIVGIAYQGPDQLNADHSPSILLGGLARSKSWQVI
jgi:hypothetical protein